MALIIPVGFGQAVYSLSLAGDNERIVTTMGHDLAAAGSNYEDAANDLHALFGIWFMGRMPSQYTLQDVTLYVGQDGGPPAIYESTEAAIVGGATTQPTPQNTAWLVRKRTGSAGRRGRGRMYIPGVHEGQVGPDGVLTNAYHGDLQNDVNGWLAELQSGLGGTGPALPPVILHRSEGIGTEPPPTPVTALQVDTLVATQRRRLRK